MPVRQLSQAISSANASVDGEGDRLDRALAGDRGGIVLGLVGIPGDDLRALVRHFATKPGFGHEALVEGVILLEELEHLRAGVATRA